MSSRKSISSRGEKKQKKRGKKLRPSRAKPPLWSQLKAKEQLFVSHHQGGKIREGRGNQVFPVKVEAQGLNWGGPAHRQKV